MNLNFTLLEILFMALIGITVTFWTRYGKRLRRGWRGSKGGCGDWVRIAVSA